MCTNKSDVNHLNIVSENNWIINQNIPDTLFDQAPDLMSFRKLKNKMSIGIILCISCGFVIGCFIYATVSAFAFGRVSEHKTVNKH